ncbi:U4/U5/U6 small nuclear ribonucleoprotein prp3 [Friedmanniomyces endolithicus]|uniref:U4/U5/U6 small nuclear ribonucleoprotein prp3 n=1 Tax=Friedmanniomyces endolithicus TaxID=329885 RepID=A0A4U0V9J2_9PEZI|nr:U4/U5/U6 small nuclear ribonucleoprotein prp3 [Friedmanniomyces endolithicus]KAK0307622.1 U4/U5/U6 small nuclear ribonucleoprotein prp3 [Friedmanniomyces endolithicus]KAK0318015.1 U4/U5/U6 small nuclear ribonucleoprotein prp3 [Friedmanniomyces endolithicus]KAK0836091.1 U4/U5/U6 small nuclear ribonucleoprotein prp3 [Friedmanniomyces endolithicus]KAK0922989.1 U4/U5/U6 small nuclear ribonucleoprotein prp3 [Friedmanniomyces endolithicus]
MASKVGKRPLPPGSDENDSKRIRSNNGSPAPALPAANGISEMERKKQEAAARMAAVKAKLAASRAPAQAATSRPPVSAAPTPPAATPVNTVEAKKLEAQRKIAEMKAKMATKRLPVIGSPASTSTAPPAPPSDREQRIAEARARAQQIAARSIAPAAAPAPAPAPPPPRQDVGKSARGGLGIGLHPSLMGDLSASGKSKGARGNQQRDTPRINPYLAAGDDDQKNEQDQGFDPSLGPRRGGERKSKQLEFNQKGKFMAQANALRQQAKLEEMKKRIAAEARKMEIEEASDKAFLVPVPPEVEWWDEGLIDKIDTEDTIITALIQHPVILKAPQDKFQPAPKPLMLTPTEQKKLRRQRRMADMKEEQAKIRLGLIDPPPPKVKKSNMMIVLGEQAVKDPTAVEARVNREIAQRASDHAKANVDRQLTKEQRAEKLKLQQAGDEARGILIAVFKVDNLSSGKHRYQVDVTAKQHALTGIVVLHPEMNLIIVEGGAHSINAYKKLMLNRIQWSENTLPLSNSAGPSTFTGANDGTSKGDSGQQNRAAQWLNPLDERGELKDLGENKCHLVWEGQEGRRIFRNWSSRACVTDGEARDVLGRSKMENMWTLGRSVKTT